MTVSDIQAPTDAQLALIRRLVREQGWEAPDAVASKREASEIIDAMLGSTYDAGRYVWPRGDEDVPFT